MATCFNENEAPNVAVVLIGGPLDGQKYAIPRIPPALEVPTSLTIPLKQPAASAPFARYGRAFEDEPIGGFYVFLFAECLGPDGDKVLYAPPEVGAPVVTEASEVISLPA